MGKALVSFLLSGKITEFNQETTLKCLKVGVSASLRVKNHEICFVRREETQANNFFSVIFQIPDKAEVLNTLRQDALHKEDWLQQIGIKAVKIGDDAYISLVHPITRSLSTTVATQTTTSYFQSAGQYKM